MSKIDASFDDSGGEQPPQQSYRQPQSYQQAVTWSHADMTAPSEVKGYEAEAHSPGNSPEAAPLRLARSCPLRPGNSPELGNKVGACQKFIKLYLYIIY